MVALTRRDGARGIVGSGCDARRGASPPGPTVRSPWCTACRRAARSTASSASSRKVFRRGSASGGGRCAARRRRDAGGRAGRARRARRLHAARHSVRARGQRGDVSEARLPAGRGLHLHQHGHRISVRAGDASRASGEDAQGSRRRRASQKEPLLYGGPNGTLQHLSVELFARTADIRVQLVPYRGSPQAVADLLGKRLDFMLDPPTAHLEAIKSGQLRALATTGADALLRAAGRADRRRAGHQGFRHRLLAGRDRSRPACRTTS